MWLRLACSRIDWPGCGTPDGSTRAHTSVPSMREEHHGLHAHRLDHVEGRRKFAVRVAPGGARLGDVLGPSPKLNGLPSAER